MGRGRPKLEEEKKAKLIYLTNTETELLEKGVQMEGFKSNSEYTGWLIKNHHQSINPAKFLKELEEQEEKLQEKIKEIKLKKKEIIRILELNKEIEIQKNRKRPEALRIIKERLRNQDVFEAERLAKTWALMLNTSATELLTESMIQIKQEIPQRI